MARVFWIAVWLLAGTGCTVGDTDEDDTDTAGTGGCPDDMHPARSPGMLFTQFTINGLSRNPLFDDAEYLGRPAGCIGDDGRSVDYLFLILGEPYGRVAMSAPRGNEGYDLNDDVGTIVIEAFAEEGEPTFENGEWVTGTWFVSSVGATFDSDMNGTGLDDDNGNSAGLQLNFTIQGNR